MSSSETHQAVAVAVPPAAAVPNHQEPPPPVAAAPTTAAIKRNKRKSPAAFRKKSPTAKVKTPPKAKQQTQASTTEGTAATGTSPEDATREDASETSSTHEGKQSKSFSWDEKMAIVQEAYSKTCNIKPTARKYGIGASVIRAWRNHTITYMRTGVMPPSHRPKDSKPKSIVPSIPKHHNKYQRKKDAHVFLQLRVYYDNLHKQGSPVNLDMLMAEWKRLQPPTVYADMDRLQWDNVRFRLQRWAIREKCPLWDKYFTQILPSTRVVVPTSITTKTTTTTTNVADTAEDAADSNTTTAPDTAIYEDAVDTTPPPPAAATDARTKATTAAAADEVSRIIDETVQSFVTKVNQRMVENRIPDANVVCVDEIYMDFDTMLDNDNNDNDSDDNSSEEEGQPQKKKARPHTWPESRTCTVILAVALSGARLPPLIIYKGEHVTRTPQYPTTCQYAAHPQAWIDRTTWNLWIQKVWTPFCASKYMAPTLLLLEETAVHMDVESLELLVQSHRTVVDHLLGNPCTQRVQVFDAGIKAAMKTAVREQFRQYMVPTDSTQSSNKKTKSNTKNSNNSMTDTTQFSRVEMAMCIDQAWKSMSTKAIQKAWTTVGYKAADITAPQVGASGMSGMGMSNGMPQMGMNGTNNSMPGMGMLGMGVTGMQNGIPQMGVNSMKYGMPQMGMSGTPNSMPQMGMNGMNNDMPQMGMNGMNNGMPGMGMNGTPNGMSGMRMNAMQDGVPQMGMNGMNNGMPQMGMPRMMNGMPQMGWNGMPQMRWNNMPNGTAPMGMPGMMNGMPGIGWNGMSNGMPQMGIGGTPNGMPQEGRDSRPVGIPGADANVLNIYNMFRRPTGLYSLSDGANGS
jgi:transposase-like protein